MSELKLNMMMSLDGFVAGPGQSEDNPFGIGGMQLNEWLFPLRVFREMHGDEFDDLGEAPPGLEQVRSVEAPGVTHLRYRVD